MGMYNTVWALVLPGAVSTWNLIVMKTSFSRCRSVWKSRHVWTGANDFVILFRIFLPLSKATVAVMILLCGNTLERLVQRYEYLSDRAKFPLQLIMREISIAGTTGRFHDE